MDISNEPLRHSTSRRPSDPLGPTLPEVDVLIDTCALCGREERLTRHHLIPRTRHHNKRNKKTFSRQEVTRVVGLCRPCHKQVHALFTEKELERDWNSIEKLKSHPEVAAFVAWIATKPFGFSVRHRR